MTDVAPAPKALTVEQAFQNVERALRYSATNLVQLALQRGPLDESLAVVAAALQAAAPKLAGDKP